MFGKYEFFASLLLGCLILLILINKPLCAVCFFAPGPQDFIHLPKGSVFQALVSGEPKVGYVNQHIEVSLNDKKLLIVADRYQRLAYGDTLEITGSVGAPQKIESFDYGAYLLRRNIQGVSYYPRISILSHNGGSILTRWMYALKDALRKPILEQLPEPHSSFLLSMTVGDDWRVSPDFRELLVRSGTVHIISISGFHMAVITVIVFLLFIAIGLERKWATMATITAISLYIIMVGSPSAAIRSGIMASLVLLAYLIGRLQRLLYSLLLAAIAMLLWDSSLLFDIGFQLSFGAMAGLAIFYPRFSFWFQKLPYVKQYALLDIIPASLAANVAIFPLLAYHFGRFSLISPLANVFILPVIPITMLFGFFAQITGLGISPLWLLLEYHIRMISFFGSLF